MCVKEVFPHVHDRVFDPTAPDTYRKQGAPGTPYTGWFWRDVFAICVRAVSSHVYWTAFDRDAYRKQRAPESSYTGWIPFRCICDLRQ